MKRKIKFIFLLLSLINLIAFTQTDENPKLKRIAKVSHTAMPLEYFININPTKEERLPIYEEIKSLNKKINQYKDSSNLYLQRGLLNQKDGMFQAARIDFNKAYSLGNKEDTLLFSMGYVRFLLGLENQASQYIDEYILINTDNSDAYFYRALIEIYCEKSKTKKQYKKAIPYSTQALSLKPDHKLALLLRGFSYHAINNFEAALTDYLYLIEFVDPNDAVYVLIGKAYLGTNNLEKACLYFKLASQVNQEYNFSHFFKYCN